MACAAVSLMCDTLKNCTIVALWKKTQVWRIGKGHNCGTLKKDTIMAHWKKTQLWHIGKRHNYGTLVKDTIVALLKKTQLCHFEKDTMVAHWKRTQLWHFGKRHNCGTLSSNISMTSSMVPPASWPACQNKCGDCVNRFQLHHAPSRSKCERSQV